MDCIGKIIVWHVSRLGSWSSLAWRVYCQPVWCDSKELAFVSIYPKKIFHGLPFTRNECYSENICIEERRRCSSRAIVQYERMTAPMVDGCLLGAFVEIPHQMLCNYIMKIFQISVCKSIDI